MSYLVLARKWRPRSFDDLVGQEPIARILRNAISQSKIAHAYVFSGPRGVGKTTTARILAKALNCKEGPTANPCGSCESCLSVTEGSSVDVIEIDGASNNSVDDVRDLRDRVKYAPSGGKYKVYIIDEVHMLSGSAFNALLKTLEEPPSHVIFVLATTEMKKIPPTVLSRCQHMPFRRISSGVIKARLKHISDAENISISEHALGIIAKAADGSMRDSLTILDQISSFSDRIDEEQVQNLLGLTDFNILAKTSKALIAGNRNDLVGIIETLAEHGSDFRAFSKELAQFFRDLLIASVVKNPADMLEMSKEELEAVKELVSAASEDQLTLMLSEIMRAEMDVRNSSLPRMALEMSLIKASYLSSLKPVKEIIENLDRMGGGLPAQTSITSHKPEESVSAPGLDLSRNDKAPEKKIAEAIQNDDPAETDPDEDHEEVAEVDSLHLSESDAPSDSGPDAEDTVRSGEEDSIHDIWRRLLDTIDAPLASKLGHASIDLSGNELHVSINSGQAVFMDTIRKNLKDIEDILSRLCGKEMHIALSAQQKKTIQKKDLKKKAMSDPAVKEALELFEGRIVDVIPSDNNP